MKPYCARHASHPRRQDGVVLLSLILVIVAAASYVLVRGLNDASQNRTATNQQSTRTVLKEAKAALIGYSISYPDKHGGDKGPGRLPCPDYAYQGTSDPVGSADSCSLGAGTETGLLPFLTIDTNEMFDASGARLWYAVSDNHRANAAGAVNSDTPGTLDIDGTDDIVALIIAPGAALSGQNRNIESLTDQYAITEYLEGENASKGDNKFTKLTGQYVNDAVITISRGELMAAAENRVLSTVSNALNQYFNDPDGDDAANIDPDCAPSTPACDDAYPWLSNFTNPLSSDYQSVVGSREGRLPIITFGAPFSTNLNFSWDIPSDGVYTNTSSYDPNNNCARLTACVVEPGVSMPGAVGTTGASCTWWGRHKIDCVSVETVNLVSGDQLEREYQFEFTGISTTLSPPTAGASRQLNFLLSNARIPPGVTAATITLRDNFIPAGGGTPVPSGEVSLTLSPEDEVTLLSLQGIRFDLEIDHDNVFYGTTPAPDESTSPGELPAWFFEDQWHHLVLVAYAAAEQAGDLDADCTLDSSCLSVSWEREGHKPDVNLTNVRGVVISAGPDLSGARPSANLSDYFEGQNASANDDNFARIDDSATFNDRIRELDPNE